MKNRYLTLAALAITATPIAVAAAELGRLDLGAPGAMISACAGIATGNGVGIGDVASWAAGGRHSCNASQTALTGASVAQSASYVEAPVTVDSAANGQVTMGQAKLYARSFARNDAGIAQGTVTGGWADSLTLLPANPADLGMTAKFVFAIAVSGTLQGLPSGNSSANLSLQPYIDDLWLPQPFDAGAPQHFFVGGQGQFGLPYDQTVDELVSFSANVTFGTPFELGIFARAQAGNASGTFGAPYFISTATTDFSNTISWAGVSSVTVSGVPVAYTLASASGIDWTQPYAAAVPEPATPALLLAGLATFAAIVRRRHGLRAA